MNKHFGWLICLFTFFSLTIISWKPSGKIVIKCPESTSPAHQYFEKYQSEIYNTANLQASGLSAGVFKKALTGFINLKSENKIPVGSSILTIIDYTKSSCEKRMWIIDVLSKAVILNTLVAHGRGSGDDLATQFSDKVDSHQSSLGFYLTDNVYYGKHGRSLKLDGLDTGFNATARAREIVIHGAPYVCEKLITLKGRLGRSYGCPAVPLNLANKVIDNIRNKTVIFINGTDENYNSKYLDEDIAAGFIQADNSTLELANLIYN